MKKFVFPIVPIIALLITTSCKKDDNNQPAPEPSQQTLRNLNVGDKWVYDFVYNNVIADSLIIEVLNQNNGEFEVQTKDMQTTRLSNRFFEDGYLKEYPKNGKKAMAVRLMKNNAKVGDSWADMDGSDSVFTTVKSINTQVTVPAGTFECVLLEIKNKKSQAGYTNSVSYAAGLVKIEITSGANKFEYQLRTKNY